MIIYSFEKSELLHRIQPKNPLQIQIKWVKITSTEAEKYMRGILNKVEFLCFDWCEIEGNFHESVLSKFINLSYL